MEKLFRNENNKLCVELYNQFTGTFTKELDGVQEAEVKKLYEEKLHELNEARKRKDDLEIQLDEVDKLIAEIDEINKQFEAVFTAELEEIGELNELLGDEEPKGAEE